MCFKNEKKSQINRIINVPGGVFVIKSNTQLPPPASALRVALLGGGGGDGGGALIKPYTASPPATKSHRSWLMLL